MTPATIARQPRTYTKRGDHSFFRDLAASQRRDPGFSAAQERLARHQRESRSIDSGSAGNFTPPAWLLSDYVPLARASRPLANAVNRFVLPAGIDSVNLPKITGGGSVAVQAFENSPIYSVDITDTFVSSQVRTIAGQSDVSLQLSENSAAAWDSAIFAELSADHAGKLDAQILSGTGTNGQLKGLDNVSGTQSLTYSDGSPTGLELAPFLAQGAALVAGKRKIAASHFVVHPRRSSWLWNESKTAGINFIDDGPDGRLIDGIPVLEDPNVATTYGTGANEDKIYTVRADDIFLWESTFRLRALLEPLSATLQVRFQLISYVALIADRQPLGIATVGGTGLALSSSTWGP